MYNAIFLYIFGQKYSAEMFYKSSKFPNVTVAVDCRGKCDCITLLL